MSTEPISRSDIDDWKVPTVVEIDSLRESQEVSKREFSEILEYKSNTSFHGAVANQTLGYNKMRKAVRYFREVGAINYVAPTVEEIADALERRDIRQTHFSGAIGYESAAGFGNAQANERMQVRNYRAAVEALNYYDRNGFIPLPYELDSLALEQ